MAIEGKWLLFRLDGLFSKFRNWTDFFFYFRVNPSSGRLRSGQHRDLQAERPLRPTATSCPPFGLRPQLYNSSTTEAHSIPMSGPLRRTPWRTGSRVCPLHLHHSPTTTTRGLHPGILWSKMDGDIMEVRHFIYSQLLLNFVECCDGQRVLSYNVQCYNEVKIVKMALNCIIFHGYDLACF